MPLLEPAGIGSAEPQSRLDNGDARAYGAHSTNCHCGCSPTTGADACLKQVGPADFCCHSRREGGSSASQAKDVHLQAPPNFRREVLKHPDGKKALAVRLVHGHPRWMSRPTCARVGLVLATPSHGNVAHPLPPPARPPSICAGLHPPEPKRHAVWSRTRP